MSLVFFKYSLLKNSYQTRMIPYSYWITLNLGPLYSESSAVTARPHAPLLHEKRSIQAPKSHLASLSFNIWYQNSTVELTKSCRLTHADSCKASLTCAKLANCCTAVGMALAEIALCTSELWNNVVNGELSTRRDPCISSLLVVALVDVVQNSAVLTRQIWKAGLTGVRKAGFRNNSRKRERERERWEKKQMN